MNVGGSGPAAESHLMRRRPLRGWGPGGVVVYTLEDLGSPAGADPKATIEVRRAAAAATLCGGGVPAAHRGHGHGRRLAAQVMTALRAEGCRTVYASPPADELGRRIFTDLGFVPGGEGTWELRL